MGSKWDNSPPNDVLDFIIQAIGDEYSIEESKKTRWMMVNKQWYDWYQSIKYKEVTISLDLSNTIFNIIFFSNFKPGKWIQSITFQTMTAANNLKEKAFDRDPLQLLMIYCPNVEHVILPATMDRPLCLSEWVYFLTALKVTNTWKLHCLFIGHFSRAILNDVAKRNYFECLKHLRRIIQHLNLTEGLVAEGYECLQMFEQLSSLVIGRFVVNNPVDCCHIIDNLPHLKKITVLFAVYPTGVNTMQEVENNLVGRSADKSTITQKAATAITHPKIDKVHLYNYDISAINNQLGDILLIKSFNMLSHLDISFYNVGKAIFRRPMVDEWILAYIYSAILSYKISFATELNDEPEYLDIYCRGLEKKQNGIGSSEMITMTIILHEDSDDYPQSVGTQIVYEREEKNATNSSENSNLFLVTMIHRTPIKE